MQQPLAPGNTLRSARTRDQASKTYALDPVTAGGTLETKRIGDYASERGVGSGDQPRPALKSPPP